MNNVKSILASKTFWFNIVSMIVAALTQFSGSDWVAQNPSATAYIVMALGFANVVLRWLTTQPVSVTGS